jgi:hypothetical protein
LAPSLKRGIRALLAEHEADHRITDHGPISRATLTRVRATERSTPTSQSSLAWKRSSGWVMYLSASERDRAAI